MSTTKNEVSGAAALLVAALTYATFGLLIREMAEMFSDSAQVAARFALAALLISIPGLTWKATRMTRQQVVRSLCLGLSFSTCIFLFTICVNETKIANAVLLMYAGSIVSSLIIGTFVLRESLTVAKVAAIVLSVAGIAIFSGVDVIVGIALITGLTSGLLDSLSNVIRKTLGDAPRMSVLRLQFMAGALAMLVIVAFSGDDAVGTISSGPIIATVIFAMLQILLGNLLIYGFRHFDVNAGTVILATEIVFAAVLGYLALSETLSLQEVVGGGSILLAAIAVSIPPNWYSKQREQIVNAEADA